MNRRDFILTTSTGALFAAGTTAANAQMQMQSGPAWTAEHGLTRFLKVDTNPLENEFEKYPRCPYCGMMRQAWSHTRHLIVYDNDTVDGTCSIHCAAISLALNMDAGPKAIYAGDAGAEADVKPLAEVSDMTYVINPAKMGTMSATSKWAFTDKAKAEAAAAGGEGTQMVGFDGALRRAYADMADDTIRLRARRAERRARDAASSGN
ncbi:MAG: hypothetical protein AUK37_02905 [Rhodobacterales bacterium CG2_30_65_12]|nr:MAG: hypothetical protein AUK37_02905 [Rhodobacterales bacterium CG2_30_65_12]